MIVNNLFPYAVAKHQIGREFTAEEMDFVVKQSTSPNLGNKTSTNYYILKDDTFSEIRKFLQQSVDDYVKAIYAPKENVTVRITQSWLNYSKPGQWHHKHRHPNSFVSGVLYLKALKEKDKVFFYKEQYETLKLSTQNWNIYNSDSWWFEIGVGDLFLFPSSLMHGVEPVKEQERISLAFNTFPVGYLGQEEELTALHLRD